MTEVIGGLTRPELLAALAAQGVQLNAWAEVLLADPAVAGGPEREVTIVCWRPRDLGLPRGGTLPETLAAVRDRGLLPLPPDAGPSAPRARGSGTGPRLGALRRAGADGALHVLAAPMSSEGEYPWGFYLRVVDGVTWLRGYRCDDRYVWPADSVLALRAADGPPREGSRERCRAASGLSCATTPPELS